MWTFLAAESAEPLILPDSVQKANLAKAVEKIATLDYHEVLQTMLSEAVWIVIKIVIALAIYFLGRWIVRRVVRLIDVAMERRKVDVSLRSFMRNTVRVVFSLILVLIVVQTLGVNVTSLIAVFSAATLAIGMALSGTAQNFAGGVMILMMKPYRVGDYISAQGQSGTVREIKLFSTVITTTDNQTIYIPNNAIATAIIDNYTTAELLVALLRHAYVHEEIYHQLLPVLPVAGRDGTLRRRMQHGTAAGNVRAKTGTVEGVSSLAGYAITREGHTLCFAIINQGLRRGADGRHFQDRVCQLLTR